MMPTAIVILDNLPLTPHGKIDKSALPIPSLNSNRIVTPPRNPIEETIRNVFAKILQHDSSLISIEDDFFTIGGNSLLAMQAMLNCRKLLNVNLPVHILFEAPTVRKLYEKIRTKPSPRNGSSSANDTN
nr:phosphopantetheine-binding protein [Legionella tunisiensis]